MLCVVKPRTLGVALEPPVKKFWFSRKAMMDRNCVGAPSSSLNQNFFTGGSKATPNVRGFTTQSIVGNFQAYGAPSHMVNGALPSTPCGSLHDKTLEATPCFPVPSVATPNRRHDWRCATHPNAIH